jgi:hypothetical protein
MSSAISVAIGALTVAAAGVIATLASWSRERITAIRAENTTRSTSSRYGERIDIDLLSGPQSRLDKAQMEAVEKLLRALENTPNAVIQVGELLLVKYDGETLVRSLSGRELRYLEKNKEVFSSPSKALEALNQLGVSAGGRAE